MAITMTAITMGVIVGPCVVTTGVGVVFIAMGGLRSLSWFTSACERKERTKRRGGRVKHKHRQVTRRRILVHLPPCLRILYNQPTNTCNNTFSWLFSVDNLSTFSSNIRTVCEETESTATLNHTVQTRTAHNVQRLRRRLLATKPRVRSCSLQRSAELTRGQPWLEEGLWWVWIQRWSAVEGQVQALQRRALPTQTRGGGRGGEGRRDDKSMHAT